MFALIDGNRAEAERALAASPRADFQDIDFSFYYPKAWFEAVIARDSGDSAGTVAAFRSTRAILAQRLIIKPEHARTFAVLAQVDAALGQKELALQEEQHAIDLMPISKDIYDGGLGAGRPSPGLYLERRSRSRHRSAAKAGAMPSYINYARLKFHPLWKPLRGNPHFEQIVASTVPK